MSSVVSTALHAAHDTLPPDHPALDLIAAALVADAERERIITVARAHAAATARYKAIIRAGGMLDGLDEAMVRHSETERALVEAYDWLIRRPRPARRA